MDTGPAPVDSGSRPDADGIDAFAGADVGQDAATAPDVGGDDAFVASDVGTDAGSDGGTDAYVPRWPFGTEGGLTVHSGETVTLTAGSVHDYASVTIEAGGTLEIGPGSDWTFIGVAGDMVVNGTLMARGDGAYHASPSTVVAQAPDDTGAQLGEVVSRDLSQASGGAGGPCGGAVTDRRPGATAFGNGGGGAGFGYGMGTWVNDQCSGCASGLAALDGAGGEGGAGICSPPGTRAAGAAAYGGAGADAPACGVACSSGAVYGGGGGGGGRRGRHGQGLYLRVAGRLTGNGHIVASGEDGGAGGDAWGSYYICNPAYYLGGGGGGGGGAGGSGGAVVIRYGVAISSVLSANVATGGGAGGAGGLGGPGTAAGGAGAPGADGADGPAPDIAQYTP